jgi:SprT protein
MAKDKFQTVLQRYLPTPALSYCCSLWEEHKFDFTVTKKRATKLGDYRYFFKSKRHMITVNGDLNNYAFLITYLHEVAHLKTNVLYGTDVKPHGQEWKQVFKSVLLPVIDVFPPEVLRPLENYLINPKASSCGDIALLKALTQFDEKEHQEYFLSDLTVGEVFSFNKRIFMKEETRRSRSLCLELKTGRKFLIPDAAKIIPVKDEYKLM